MAKKILLCTPKNTVYIFSHEGEKEEKEYGRIVHNSFSMSKKYKLRFFLHCIVREACHISLRIPFSKWDQKWG
jgi:hypothetical protein